MWNPLKPVPGNRTASCSVTVAVPTYNRAILLRRTLRSFLFQTLKPTEILVYDDASRDRTSAELEAFGAEADEAGVPFRYFTGKTNMGCASARNTLASHAHSGVILYTDDDVLCPRDWLEHLSSWFSDQTVGAVGGPSISVDGNFNVLFPIRHDDDNLNSLNEYGEFIGWSDRWIPSRPIETNNIQGSNMAFRADVLKSLGGFDPGFEKFAMLVETDMTLRVQRLGYKLIYDPISLNYHLQIPVGGHRTSEREKWFWYGVNWMYFLHKNFPERKRAALVRLCLRLRWWPTPLWKVIAAVVAQRNLSRLWQLAGYYDGWKRYGNQRIPQPPPIADAL